MLSWEEQFMYASQNELLEYVKRVGENINVIYKKVGELGTKLDALTKEVNEIKETMQSDEDEIKDLKDNVVTKTEFNDFVKRLTDSFSAVIQPFEPPKEASSE